MFIDYLINIFVPTSSRILDGFFAVGIFLFGLCIGSFLNCYIYRRLPASADPRSAESYGEARQEKSLKGRSFCPNCKHTLLWKDLFPVFSFLFLGGKCRYCHKKISWQYPLVEIATGVLFVLIFSAAAGSRLGGTIFSFLNLAFLLYITSALIIIFIYDLKHYLIPDKVLFPAIIISLIYNLIHWQNILNALLAVIIASGFFLIIFLISKGKWMGFGDVKLAVLMGLLLGFPNVLLALFLAFFFGAIIGLTLMFLEKKNLKSEIPFGPFLIIGTFISIFWGSQIIQWYINFFQI
jgi:prepilin signal peptidase PulO-like enzyme (type II secretory pathway)